ncbi:MAG: IS3 family transposase, partial [Turicibacter sp.]|nr:IS3 family transposase [Turicibacter sp.]
MKLSKSTYYYEINRIDFVKERDKGLTAEIQEIFDYHKGRYGVRRIYRELKNNGRKINHKRIQRIMHDMGMKGKRPKEKYHSYKGELGKVADNI